VERGSLGFVLFDVRLKDDVLRAAIISASAVKDFSGSANAPSLAGLAGKRFQNDFAA